MEEFGKNWKKFSGKDSLEINGKIWRNLEDGFPEIPRWETLEEPYKNRTIVLLEISRSLWYNIINIKEGKQTRDDKHDRKKVLTKPTEHDIINITKQDRLPKNPEGVTVVRR